jgi:hypothetical protein
MLKFYGDNSAFRGSKGAEMEDIILFGGIIISNEAENHLISRVYEIKKKYCGWARAPIKYNFKDLKKCYSGWESKYHSMLTSSVEWRREIFSAINETECKIVVSVIESHQTKKREIAAKKNDLTSYMFSNLLMRLGLELKVARKSDNNLECQLILDWPEAANPTIFNREYASAFNRGLSLEGIRYISASLQNIGFKDSILYGAMENTTMLQLADLVVGASKDFVQNCVGTKPDNCLGVELLKSAKVRLREYPSILNFSIIVCGQNKKLKDSLKIGIAKHLCKSETDF